VTLVKGPEDVTKVTGSFLGVAFETWIVILLGAAVALAASATMLAASAAYGSPRRFRFVGSEVRRLYREQASAAALRLGISRWLAVGAVVALAVAVGLTWLETPDETALPSRVLVVDSTGVRACGELLPSTAPGRLSILETGNTTATEVSVSDVKALGVIAACPGDK